MSEQLRDREDADNQSYLISLGFSNKDLEQLNRDSRALLAQLVNSQYDKVARRGMFDMVLEDQKRDEANAAQLTQGQSEYRALLKQAARWTRY